MKEGFATCGLCKKHMALALITAHRVRCGHETVRNTSRFFLAHTWCRDLSMSRIIRASAPTSMPTEIHLL